MINKTLTLGCEDHSVKAIKYINDTNSRFAYELKNNNGYTYKGLWTVESYNSDNVTFTYIKHDG